MVATLKEVTDFKKCTQEQRNLMFLSLKYDLQSKADELSQKLSETTLKTATLLEHTSGLSTLLTDTPASLKTYEARILDYENQTSKELAEVHHLLTSNQQSYTFVHTALGTKLDEQAGEINDIASKNLKLEKSLKKAQKKAKKTEKKVREQGETLQELNRMHQVMQEELLRMRREFETIQQQQNEIKILFSAAE